MPSKACYLCKHWEQYAPFELWGKCDKKQDDTRENDSCNEFENKE